MLYKGAFQSNVHHSQFNLGLYNSWYLPYGIVQGELSTQIEPSNAQSITLLASMILALSPKTDYTASLQLRSQGNNEPRIPSINVIDIDEGHQVRMGLSHRWSKHYIHGALSLYSSRYNDLNNKNQSQIMLGGRYEYKRNRQENMYVLARYRRSLDIETTSNQILIRVLQCYLLDSTQVDFESKLASYSTRLDSTQSEIINSTRFFNSTRVESSRI